MQSKSMLLWLISRYARRRDSWSIKTNSALFFLWPSAPQIYFAPPSDGTLNMYENVLTMSFTAHVSVYSNNNFPFPVNNLEVNAYPLDGSNPVSQMEFEGWSGPVTFPAKKNTSIAIVYNGLTQALQYELQHNIHFFRCVYCSLAV
jgi:hypothetical protein